MYLCFAGGTPALLGSARCGHGQRRCSRSPVCACVCARVCGCARARVWVRARAGVRACARARVRARMRVGVGVGGYVLLAHVCDDNLSLS